jgi:transposase
MQELLSKNLDHLGIVAGIIDEIGIEQKINEILDCDVREKVSAGKIVKAILLNNLGFVTKPLYLFSQYFQDKPVEHLLGKGMEAAELNDDKIGRVLDKLYDNSLTTIFSIIVISAANKYQVKTTYSHLDSTSISVHGEYKQFESSSEIPLKITYGYSRDHRPDLKQFMLDLIVSSDGDIPLFLRTASGNEADKAVFGQIINDYQKQIDFDSIMVCESALYSTKNLETIKNYKWICRVPFTVKKARELASTLDGQEFQKANIPGYSYLETSLNHSGIQQRWLIVKSGTRKQADLTSLEDKISKEALKMEKFLQKHQRQKCDSLAEIKLQVKQFNRDLKYHQIQSINYPETPVSQTKVFYSISGTVVQLSEVIAAQINLAGRFIVATNVLDIQELSSEDILSTYKAQQSGERGFRFLKDPLFLLIVYF